MLCLCRLLQLPLLNGDSAERPMCSFSWMDMTNQRQSTLPKKTKLRMMSALFAASYLQRPHSMTFPFPMSTPHRRRQTPNPVVPQPHLLLFHQPNGRIDPYKTPSLREVAIFEKKSWNTMKMKKAKEDRLFHQWEKDTTRSGRKWERKR